MFAIEQPTQMINSKKQSSEMSRGLSKTWRVSALGILMILLWLGPIKHGLAAETGQEIFQTRCSACHTIGKGKTVGPDLAGVTSRREDGWLVRQIKEPDVLLAEKDPIAIQLLQESNNVPMVPLGLNETEISAVIAYLKSTEQQVEVATGLPSQYMPTVLISIVVLIVLTLIGLKAGSKEVDVR
ncbi:MAG: hypothetical protein CMQ20_12470 [Gammaproteobacteria bacterium]|jgi:mono/diheme cytochrome c family protein|nr:hypothetical protein [Gammaproteobacteria bacterium]|tara:strand:+ start:1885 stop:2436 length:552 start_codon:yes stop_codon:yes gene_type:complete